MLISTAFFALAAAGTAAAQASTYRFAPLKTVRPEIEYANYTPEQKTLVAKQAREMLYVNSHRYVKKDTVGVDVIAGINKIVDEAPKLSNKAFNEALSGLFLSLRDFHTNYYNTGAASCYTYLTPFSFQFVDSKDIAFDPRIVVQSLTTIPAVLQASPEASKVQVGDLLTKIDGLSFREHWEKNKAKVGGANRYGGYRSALGLLSQRGGLLYPTPENDTIKFTFSRNGKSFDVTVPWVTAANKACIADAPLGGGASKAPTNSLTSEKKYHGLPDRSPKEVLAVKIDPRVDPSNGLDAFPTDIGAIAYKPTESAMVFYSHYTHGGRNLGVIRLTSFTDAADPTSEIALGEVRRLLLEDFAETDAVLVDLRDNGGGSLNYADTLPQYFGHTDYAPGYGRAIVHPNNAAIFLGSPYGGSDWAAAYNATKPGDKYTPAIRFNAPEVVNTVGTLYLKPVGLLTDANCYSACDTFSGAMKDNGFATIFGEDKTTGAGGANVVEHRSFFQVAAPQIFKPLPYQDTDASGATRKGVGNFRTAWRATIRSGLNNGKLIEDYGISSDVVVRQTVADVIGSSNSSTQFDKIADYLKQKGVKSNTAKLFFQSPLDTTRGFIGQKLAFPYTSQDIKLLVVKDAAGKEVARASPSPVHGRTKGVLSSKGPLTAFGYTTYTITGYNADDKKVLKTHRTARVQPGPSDYLKVSAGQTYKFANTAADKKYAVVYNLNTPAANGFQINGGKLTVGNGKQYVDNTNSAFTLFTKLPGSGTLSFDVDGATEQDYDYLTVYVRDSTTNAAPVVIYKKSGQFAESVSFDISNLNGAYELTFEFTSDGGVTDRGVTLSNIAIKA
ncbi:uncharacterized protein EV422DRAFT_107984 [Fimicolochytrium jonesii]|uniref:uncharacterized protein n=1 Tax=Fimicolochytrium jonesii TaxID=1396493 RepID=UPI0022FDD8F0|nr:uncharacterized protein EV422DRAFT_107984 [Fimicolochytrium jonesii]KAI8819329.1 hypothetical protein EV422DRAFT_107984 [Fimicolochytrium jonesii]